MKPSEKRYNLFLKGKSILRSQAFHTGNGMFWHIVTYNGKGWARWHSTDFYESNELCENAIKNYCELDPSFINDSTIN